MTDTTRRFLRYGIHSDGQDMETEPTLVRLLPDSPEILRPSPGYSNIERDHVRINGTVEHGLRGRKRAELGGDIVHEVEGLSGSGAGDGVDASTLSTVTENFNLACFAAEAAAATGDTTDGADAGSGTTINMDGVPGFTVRNFVLALTTTGQEYQARMIEAVGNPDITITHALTTPVGAADTADEGEVAYASRTWTFDPDVHNHRHLWFTEEFDGLETDMKGCFPSSVTWTLTGGEPLRQTLSGLTCSDWDDVTVTGSADVVPTTGSKVVCTPLYVWVGGNMMLASNLTVDLGLRTSDREFSGSETGMRGKVVTSAKPMISGTLLYGSHTDPDEADETFVAAREGAQPYSSPTTTILVQAGAQPGATAAWYLPNARFKPLSRTTVDGVLALEFEAEGTAVVTQTVNGSIYYGLM